jgi:serine/threonine protein phosphatase PrpC
VQAAYEQLYSAPTSWSLTEVDVYLDAAYTGLGSTQIGSIHYPIAPSDIQSDGGPSAPRLLVLPLGSQPGMPTHDLPVLSLPQPSDPPASGAPEILDLTGPDGSLLARSALELTDPTSVVYPVDLPSDRIITPTSASPAPAATSSANSPTANQLSLGAPAIDSNGRLVGMIVGDAQGNHVFLGTKALTATIGSVTGAPGPLMAGWQTGLIHFYNAQYQQAQQQFSSLLSTYKDFGGVAAFLAAAKRSSPNVSPLTQAPPANSRNNSGGGNGTGAGLSAGTVALLIGLGLAALILIAGGALALIVRARGRRAAELAAYVPPEEVGLDLLPRESMYSPVSLEDLPTAELPAIPSRDGKREEGGKSAASPLPSAVAGTAQSRPMGDMAGPAAIMRASPVGPRQPTTLMPHAAGLTDPGRRRASDPNQDSIFALEGIRMANGRPLPYGIFIVADGMGGHEHGRVASAAAIEVLVGVIERGLAGAQWLDEHMLAGLLRDGIRQAHEDLRRRNSAVHADMGTTITAALVEDDVAYVANVGDSRTYVMSPDAGLRQITTDHSIVASLVAAGVIRPDEIYTHPRRNQIYRSLGGDQAEMETDTFVVPLQAGDKLLLCSDGLWEMVRDQRIEQILRATADSRQAAELLVREANANGGEDNIGAIVVRMVEEMPERPRPGSRIVAASADAYHR